MKEGRRHEKAAYEGVDCRRQAGLWTWIVTAAPFKEIKPGQILGFQIVQGRESPLNLAERFIDIIARRETVMDLFGHYFIHSPAHNAVDDPYLGLLFQAQHLFMRADGRPGDTISTFLLRFA